MSISACPRCFQKISIPAGVRATAKVRCPLCQAQYVLADALAEMPPMLEVIDGSDEFPEADDRHSTDLATPAGRPSEVLAETLEMPADLPQSDSTLDLGATVSAEHDELAPALDDDDALFMSDKDTEIEDAGFGTSAPLVREASVDLDPIELSSIDEQTVFEFENRKRDADKVPPSLGEGEAIDFDFEETEPTSEAPSPDATVEFSPAGPENAEVAEDFELEFDEVESSEAPTSPDATIEFSPAEPRPNAAEEEIELNFDEFESPQELDSSAASTIEFSAADISGSTAGADEGEIEFGAADAGAETVESNALGFVRDPGLPPSEGEEIGLDFGAADATGESGSDADQPSEDDGKKKKKAKKAKKEKKVKVVDESGEEKPRRSLVGMLVSVMLGGVVALPLALYGIMWMGPDYDFFKVGKTLASWKIPLPAAFSKSQQPRMIAAAPTSTPPAQAIPVAAPAGTPPETAPPETAPADAAPQDTPPSEPVAEQPAAPAATSAPSTEPPVSPPAADLPAASEPSPGKPDLEPATAANEPVQPAGDTPGPAMPKPGPADAAPSDADPAKSPPIEAVAGTKSTSPAAEEMPAEEMPEEEKPAELTESQPEARMAAKPASEGLPLPDLDEKPSATSRRAPSADEKPALGDEPAVPADVDLIGPADAPQFTVADLGQVMQTAGAAEARLLDAQRAKDDAAIKSARSQFYLSFFRLAEVLTFATDSAGDGRLSADRDSIGRIVSQFASDKKRLDALKFNAARWLSFSKRTTPGIVVAGTVIGSESAGKLHHVKLGIGLNREEPVVTVVTRADPHLNPGDTAFVLGSIVERPGERLIGYDGDEPIAIWSGMALKLPVEK
jgi:hypothetical protein